MELIANESNQNAFNRIDGIYNTQFTKLCAARMGVPGRGTYN